MTGMSGNEPAYVISVAAQLLGMHVQTLRYYERAGILQPSRSQGNIRLYSQHDLQRVQEVRGPGVVGEQPILEPGESFEYTSGCPLATPSGIMVGSYEMTTAAGERFEIRIPAFSLDSPHEAARLQ